MTCFVTFISSSSDYINNPYLRGKLVEALAMLTPKFLKKDFMKVDVWLFNEIAVQFLPEALIQFYIDIEQTGSM